MIDDRLNLETPISNLLRDVDAHPKMEVDRLEVSSDQKCGQVWTGSGGNQSQAQGTSKRQETKPN
jgi:hypothetical protein